MLRMRVRAPDRIQGPPLCGFWSDFERAFGDPTTDPDRVTIVPSFVGNSMLPFRCPGCGEVPQALACPETRKDYFDDRPGRENHFCPFCGMRFRIDLRGMPLPTALEPGVMVGPSRIVRDGVEAWQDRPGDAGKVARVVLGAAASLLMPVRSAGILVGAAIGFLPAPRVAGGADYLRLAAIARRRTT